MADSDHPEKPSTQNNNNNGKTVDLDEHLMPIEAVCQRYQVTIDQQKPQLSQGLTTAQVTDRTQTYGKNIMTPPKQLPLFVQYLVSLSNLFNVLLIVSGVLCYCILIIDATATSNIYIGAVLIGVACINALIEFVQEQKSKAILKSFMDLVPRKCMALRNGGTMSSIEACDLVPGDVVVLRMGDKIPADVLVFAAIEFKVDNSSLTGEADPQERKPSNSHGNPLEATNLAFNGTLAVNGEAYGIVVKTGDHTVLGQIANMASSEVKRDSPMTQEIESFVHTIASVAAVVAIVFFIIGITKNTKWADNINFAISVFVSFVPEGLPATVTMLLSIAAKRMAQRNVLVKDLRGVETLGAITCLATDKTGTLTCNQMTVTYMWTGQKMYDATEADSGHSKKSPDGKSVAFPSSYPGAVLQPETFTPFSYDIPELKEMANVAYLCSKARFNRTDVPIKQRSIIADATETGLFRFAANKIPDSDHIRDVYPKVFEVPFNSSNKWALTINEKPHENGDLTLYIKGAPERVFRLCTTIVTAGNAISPMTESHKISFQKAYESMASKGHRVIGCAKLLLPRDKYPKEFVFRRDAEDENGQGAKASGVYPAGEYTFMGLVSLEDPPKHGVREAIGQCRQAGIKVMMVTGDHPLTAEAIARKINLMLQDTKEMVAKRLNRAVSSIQEHEYHAIVIHGEMVDKLTEEDWENILEKEEIIFARTSPKHKLQIVKRCQARGHIVGVTGDGVNDSPALKKADLGIAMNVSGSDVSKEAAAMILLDDNFASTVSGIAEGRLIFQNLKKSIKYTITHTMPQVFSGLLYLLVPLPLPLGPLQIIFVDLGFELFLSLVFAWEAPESGMDAIMKMLPRKPVSARSVDLLRRRNKAEAVKTQEIYECVYGKDGAYFADLEAQKDKEKKEMTLGTRIKFRLARMKYALVHLFDRKAWSLYFEKQDEEVLVDVNVLSYAYLEMGIIETIGCLLAFFFAWYYQFGDTLADVQRYGLDSELRETEEFKNREAYTQSVYYFSLFILQVFNHFICKCTFDAPFGKFVLRNMYTWYGIISGAAFSSIIVYAPGGRVPFNTLPINPIQWLIPMGMGFVMLGYGTLRIMYLRSRKPVNVNLQLPLDLHPTRWSTISKE